MERKLRLRKNTDYQSVFKTGKSCWNRQFTMLLKENNLGKARIGFTVTKKFGSAVMRNTIKRRLKEIIRNNQDLIPVGYDIVIIPKKNTIEMDFKSLTDSLIHIFKVSKKIRKK